MKTKSDALSNPSCLLLRLLVVGGLAVASVSPVLAASTPAKDNSLTEKMSEWQDKMSDKFRDTWKRLWGDKPEGAAGERSLTTASLDLREQTDGYVIRLDLPNRDLSGVEVTLDGETLRIHAPAEEKVGRYEQTLTLAGAKPDAKPEVDRRPDDHLIVISVPKVARMAEDLRSDRLLPDPALAPLTKWDQEILSRMERMREDMDRVFQESLRDLRLGSEGRGFFDEPRFGSSLDVQEEGNNYVVRAYLPERDMKDVEVKVENNVLKIEAKAEETKNRAEGSPSAGIVRKAQYSQVLTLPGPVQIDKMKVDKKAGMLVVTLPKAESK